MAAPTRSTAPAKQICGRRPRKRIQWNQLVAPFFTIPLAEHGPKETESSWLSFHFRSSSFFCKIAAADLTQDLRNESNRTSWLLLFFKKKMSIPLVEDGPKETEPSWLSFHFRLSRSYSWVQAVVSERCGARSDER